MKTYDWIVNESKLPWLKLNISFPYEEMHREAVALKDSFVAHRDKDGDAASGGYSHKGWRSLCIHGIDHEKTNHFVQYGYNSHEETPYRWTDICDKCPVTTNFFQNDFPFKEYYRVRFMLLEPGGYITPHEDQSHHSLSPVNMALNNPKGCKMKMKSHSGYVPFHPGTALLLDVGNTHAVFNDSNEDRYHIIVHGIKSKEFKKVVEDSYAQNGS
jgi:hypothetical protein